jgi:hypothetical protein
VSGDFCGGQNNSRAGAPICGPMVRSFAPLRMTPAQGVRPRGGRNSQCHSERSEESPSRVFWRAEVVAPYVPLSVRPASPRPKQERVIKGETRCFPLEIASRLCRGNRASEEARAILRGRPVTKEKVNVILSAAKNPLPASFGAPKSSRPTSPYSRRAAAGIKMRAGLSARRVRCCIAFFSYGLSYFAMS